MQIANTENGCEVIKLARTEIPNLILIDIGLPDISGYEAIHQNIINSLQ